MDRNIVVYKNGNLEIPVYVEKSGDTVWLNKQELSELFDRDIKTIEKHINNILNEEELDNSTVANFSTNHNTPYYNLDMIISIGYRIDPKKCIHFRKWTHKILKKYILKDFSINEAMAEYNKKIDSSEALSLINSFSETWFTLDKFDKGLFPNIQNNSDANILVSELYNDLEILKRELIHKKEATSLFAQEKIYNSLGGIFGNVFQSAFGQDIYPSMEEKAAHLLYFIVKNHPFTDGNKRSGAFAFIWLLKKFNYHFITKINPQALSTLTLVIASSDPKEKDKMIGLVKLLLN